MGCSNSTGKGVYPVNEKEVNKLRNLTDSEKRKPVVGPVFSQEQEPVFAMTAIQVMEDLNRRLHWLLVNNLRVVTISKGKQLVNNAHLLEIKDFKAGLGETSDMLTLVLAGADAHPLRLQTTALGPLVLQLRRALAALTVGTPPQFLPYRFACAAPLARVPLGEVPLEGRDGGWSAQFRGFLSLRPETASLGRQAAFVAAAEGRPPAVTRGPALWLADACRLQQASPAVTPGALVAALRALRFNTHFVALRGEGLVGALGRLGGGDPEKQAVVWRALAEVLGYNVALAELHLPAAAEGEGPPPGAAPAAAAAFAAAAAAPLGGPSAVPWAALGQALLYNPRPFVSVWGLAGHQMGDQGLGALLPGLARVFCTVAPPRHLDLGGNGLGRASVGALLGLLGGAYGGAVPADGPIPPPPPPYLGKLAFLSLAGSQLGGCGELLAGPLAKMAGLKTLLLDRCDLGPEDLAAVCGALVESGCPLEALGAGNPGALAAPAAWGDAVGRVLFHKKATLATLGLDLGAETLVAADALARALGGYAEPAPGVTVRLTCGGLAPAAEGEGAPAAAAAMTSSKRGGFLGGLLKGDADGGGGGGGGVGGLCAQLKDTTGIVALLDIVKDCPSLKRLQLVGWVPSQANVLSQAVEKLSTIVSEDRLESLLIPGGPMGMGPSFFRAFAELALGTTTALKELDVSNHIFGDEGAVALGQALRKNRSITRLWFDMNQIKLAGLQGFRGCLYGNKKLVEVGLPLVDFNVFSMEMDREYAQRTGDEPRLRGAMKAAYKQDYFQGNLRNGRGQGRAQCDVMVANKIEYKRIAREQAKAKKIFADIQQDCQRNIALYEDKTKEKSAARREKQANKYLPKWKTKQVKIRSNLQQKVGKMREKRKKDKVVTKKYKYYSKKNQDPYRRYRDQDGEYYIDPKTGKKVYHQDSYYDNYPYYWHDTPYGYYHHDCYGRPPYEDHHHPEGGLGGGEELPPDGVELGQTEGEALGEDWEPEVLPPEVAGDNLDRMEELLQDPQFFNEENLAEFELLAGDLGGGDALAFDTGICQAGDLSGQMGAKADEWGTDLGAELAEQDVTIEPLAEEEAEEPGEAEAEAEVEVEVEEGGGDEEGGGLEDVDMYAGAGPRDLPDGGPSGGRGGAGPVRSGPAGAGAADGGARWRARQRARRAAAGRPDLAAARARAEDPLLKELEARQETERVALAGEVCPLMPLEYRTQPHAYVSAGRPAGGSRGRVSLVTQCSVDRLPFLKDQLTAWGGIASIAVYIRTESAEQQTDELKQVESFFKAMDALNSVWLDVGLLFGFEEKPWMEFGNTVLYPINTLRNLALAQSMEHEETDYNFLVDADFVPSAGLREAIESNTEVRRLLTGAAALVVPAFEPVNAAAAAATEEEKVLPSTQEALSSLWVRGAAAGFHTSYYPKGHGPTNFVRWFEAKHIYPIAYEQNFEPYVVMRKDLIPLYDERFRGYGMNKISHLLAVHCAGIAFHVLPSQFVISHPHDRSANWQTFYGKDKDPMMAYRLKHLWKQFQSTVKHSSGVPVISNTTKTFFQLFRDFVSSRPVKEAYVEHINVTHITKGSQMSAQVDAHHERGSSEKIKKSLNPDLLQAPNTTGLPKQILHALATQLSEDGELSKNPWLSAIIPQFVSSHVVSSIGL